MHGTPFRNRVVVVTGGAQGIGLAIAHAAAARGASAIALLDIDEHLVHRSASAVGSAATHVLPLAADVADERAVAEAVATVAAEFGRLDVLVNNAGRNSYAEATALSEHDWDSTLAVDLKAAWLCAKHALPHLIDSGHGSIVNIASVHAEMTSEGTFPYAVAKSGILGLTRSLALDYGPRGVRVNAVSPGYTDTRLVREGLERSGADSLDRIACVHALRRIGTPAEVATVVCFLASDEASFVTGANWVVDGGISARFA